MLPSEENKPLKTIESSGSDLNSSQIQVEVDYEIRTTINDDLISSSDMAQTKQTARKEPSTQGSPARFPKKGKPGGKAGRQMVAYSQDNNNNSVAGTVRAGRRRRVWGGKARTYKRPASSKEGGVTHKYRPGTGAPSRNKILPERVRTDMFKNSLCTPFSRNL